jgi:hypothetical protein
MAVTARNGKATKLPSRKITKGFIAGMAAVALILLIAVPLLNEFILSPANRIDLSPQDFAIPILGLVTFAVRGYLAAPHDDEGVLP